MNASPEDEVLDHTQETTSAPAGPAYRKLGWKLAFLPLVWCAAWVGINMHVFGVRLVHFSGRNMLFGLELDYAMGLFWWFVIATALFVLFDGQPRRMLMTAWLVKFFVVLVAMLVYERFYDLDAYTYFNSGATGRFWMYPGHDFRQDMLPALRPIEQTGDLGSFVTHGIGTENGVRFMVLMASITGPFYHAMKIGFAFLGLLGVWWFYRAVEVTLGRPYPQAFYLLAFFPSILFWSSILGKDPLQLVFLGLYAYGGAMWLVQGRFAALWYVGLGLFGSYLFRPWTAIMGAAVLGLATLMGRCRPWQVGLTLSAVLVSLLIVSPQAMLFSMGLTDIYAPEMLVEAMGTRAQAVASAGGSQAELPKPGEVSIPLIIFSGLFRPLPFDITNAFTALAAVENSVILWLCLVALIRFRLGYLRDPLVIWLLSMTLLWALLYGLIVMANFGSGARYKLQILPFFLLGIIALVHKEGRAFLDSRLPVRRTG
ncbi:MAG: hypothetical protein EPO61_01290 [Nitrospirae bacterium]|nr:MAG: hypothetical protein EPO61_01290 [Nitrospirota bacterium]